MTQSYDQPLKSSNPDGPIVMIATPAYAGCHPLYVTSLIEAMRALNRLGFRVQTYFSQGCSIITNAREELLGAFLASKASYLVMIDSDIGWPADLIPRLLALREPMVAAAVPYRTIDVGKIEAGTYADGITFNITPTDPEELRACPQKHGFVRVHDVGTAFFMVTRDAILAMIRRYPDLEIQVSGLVSYALFAQVIAGGKHAGEDKSFFARWTALGGEIWVCTDAEITHTGPMTVGGSLARKLEDTIDPGARWLAGSAHVLRDLPGAAPPAPAPAPATAAGTGTGTAPAPAAQVEENGNGHGNGHGPEEEAPTKGPDPDATLDPSREAPEKTKEAEGEGQASV